MGDVKVCFTEDEAKVSLIQLIARKDELDKQLVNAAQQKNITRIRELGKYIDNLQSAIDKMCNAGSKFDF